MRTVSKEAIQWLREEYPTGTRVELISMEDSFNRSLLPGAQGTVAAVDSIGTVHVKWDCGSSRADLRCGHIPHPPFLTFAHSNTEPTKAPKWRFLCENFHILILQNNFGNGKI